MKLDQIVELLERVPLFEGLSSDEMHWLALNGEPVVFVEGREIIREDETGDASYLLLAGEATRKSGFQQDGSPEKLVPGSLIGEMAMLIETSYGSTVLTGSTVRALKFRRSLLHGLMTENPTIAAHFSHKISERFLNFAEKLKKIESSFSETLPAIDASHKQPELTEMVH